MRHLHQIDKLLSLQESLSERVILRVMGIAFAVIYLPALGILSAVAIYFSMKLAIHTTPESFGYARDALGILTGTIVTGGLILFAVSALKSYGITGFQSLIYAIAVSLLFPLIMGLLLTGITYLISKKLGYGVKIATANRIGLGALNTIWAFPLIGLIYAILLPVVEKETYYFSDEYRQKMARFDELCAENRIDVRKIATDATSVYIPRRTRLVDRLLEKVDFIESDNRQNGGQPRYIRLIPKEGYKRPSHFDENLIKQPVEELEARYEVTSTIVSSESDKAKHIHTEEVTIRDRRTGEILALFSIVTVSHKGDLVPSRSCPKTIGNTYTMVPYVLGLMDKEEAARFAKELSTYQNSLLSGSDAR